MRPHKSPTLPEKYLFPDPRSTNLKPVEDFRCLSFSEGAHAAGGYSARHPTIVVFWEVVRGWPAPRGPPHHKGGKRGRGGGIGNSEAKAIDFYKFSERKSPAKLSHLRPQRQRQRQPTPPSRRWLEPIPGGGVQRRRPTSHIADFKTSWQPTTLAGKKPV